MKKQEFAKLLSVVTLDNSVNGNPNYSVILELGNGHHFITRSSSDCSWCYGYSANWIGKTVTYTTTKSGRINYMKLTTIEDTFTDKLTH